VFALMSWSVLEHLVGLILHHMTPLCAICKEHDVSDADELFIIDLPCASVAMDSPLASPAKAELPLHGGPGTAEAAGPCPRFVTSEELHILQTCLTRWRTEVEQDIKGSGSSSFIA